MRNDTTIQPEFSPRLVFLARMLERQLPHDWSAELFEGYDHTQAVIVMAIGELCGDSYAISAIEDGFEMLMVTEDGGSETLAPLTLGEIVRTIRSRNEAELFRLIRSQHVA